MSSALRMLLIAIVAVGQKRRKKTGKRETEKEEKDREGTRLKTRLPESREKNVETLSHYTGDTLEMEQETRTCEKEVMSDRVN